MSAHSPESLVKFCSSNTAKKMLTTHALRWSAPHLSSDPFELNHQSQLNFDPHSLLQAAIKTATAMIFAKDAPRGNTPLLTAIRRWREEERFASPEEADEVLGELLSQIVDQRQNMIDQVMTEWRKFTRTLRSCSFTARPDNLAAWQHYADNHRGIALRFRCGENSALAKPMPVEYKSARPEITTLKEQLETILGAAQVTPQDQFYQKLLTKPVICRDEQEWRCFDTINEDFSADNSDASQWFKDYKFESNELMAVYLGAFTSAKDKRDIYDLIKEKYSHTKIFQARTVEGKYELAFERITSR